MYTIISPQAGTLASEGKDSVITPGSGTPEIINASQTTNDGITGRWHYRVDCSNATDCIGMLRSLYISQLLSFFEHVYILTDSLF